MRIFNKNLRLQDVTIMYLTALAAVMVILVASYQVPSSAVEVPSLKSNPSSSLPPLQMPFRVPLDPRGELQLAWNISYADQEIYMELRIAELKHGVILGMSDRGELTNADLVVLWDSGTKSYFGDAWSDSKGHVSLDRQQDYELIETKQKPDSYYLLFKRSFSTCDPRDYLIEEGTVHIIYGFLDQPLASLEQLNLSQIHTGLQRVLLLRPDTPSPTLPPDVQKLEVLAPNVIIPNQETTYWCFIQTLPENMPKSHIVMYESVITPGNEAIVHHIEVFECSPDVRDVPDYSGSCDDKMKPGKLDFCRHVLAAWAMGAEALPSGGINIFASQLHTHLAGRGVRTVLVRGGKELEVVQEDQHFSTHYQTIRVLLKMVTVLPGGFGIMEEMCVNYIHYYPRTRLELCKTHVDPEYLQKYFNFINRFHGNDQCVCGEVNVTKQYSQLQWDAFTGEVLDSLYNTAPVSMHCNQSSARLFPGEWDKQPVPVVTSILEKPRYPCEGGAPPTRRPATPPN
ncbi:Dopamine beta-hydroxylase [Collichthys lucidus]|uniref:Dopamine beta-hydroxylase n=1 Tax=Collichthys lucidus TaxID=240159 RepID=A0A4U5V9Q2_COLLU|nr:Dopamine beta-hydroxylase [Collichthys lucidus]